MTDDTFLLVFTTAPNHALAEQLSFDLVQRELVACAHLLPAGSSIYAWEGRIQSAQEIQIILKTRRGCYPALEAAIIAAHPYAVPEIVAANIACGLPSYLDWIKGATAATKSE